MNTSFPFFASLFLFVASLTPAHAEPQRIGGLIVAGHAWTWGKGTVFEAIDHCHEAGVDALEVFLMGQTLSAQTGGVLLGETMPEDALAALQAKCAASGVRIVNAYIGQKQWTRIGQDEAALRKFFDFGKRLGVAGFTGEPAEAQWDMVEKMVREYGVTFSIHNHAKGFAAEYFGGPYPYWDPRETAAKLNAQKRDPRFGICLDTGHAARSGLDTLTVLKAIAGRCISVHLKDISAATLDAHDVPYGQGINNVPGLLAELRRQEIKGHLGLEYEWGDSPTFASDVKAMVEFIRAPASASEPGVRRYLYAVTPDGAQMESSSGNGILVFDIDHDFQFVRRIEGLALIGGARGLTGSTGSHSLFYSTTDRRMGRLDLNTDKLVWEAQFTGGCDRSAVAPDGSKVFAPTGWWEGTDNGGFVVIDGNTGQELRRIRVGKGAHNSIMSPDGTRLFLGTTTTLTEFDTKDERVLQTIPEVGEAGVFPFTVNSRLTLAFVCLGKHVGFDVVDLAQGKPIQRVLAGSEPIAHRTHGIALSPDESELWISDQIGQKLFIFDATQMPPVAKGSVALSAGGHGWVNFSLDGAFVWNHTPDVFDAKSKKLIATLRDETGKPFASSKLIEVQMRDGKVSRVGSEFGIGRRE